MNNLLVQGLFLVLVGLMQATSLYAQLPAGMPDAAKPGTQNTQEAFAYPELEPEPGKYIVPPVVDRPLGPTEGPKIQIQAIDLRGVTDRPEHGLKVDDVWKIIEKNRTAYPEGLTIGQLQEMANQITNHYRDHNFIVAHAFIPVQTVEDGIVTVQVLEGVLGRVLVEGAAHYDPEQLAIPFEPLIGQPVTKEEVESTLIRMGDYPGVTTFGVFQPGQEIGDSDLVLKIQEEDKADLWFRLDNHGSRYTGEYQARMDLSIYNMFGQADELRLGFQEKFNPSNSDLKSIEYSQMIFKPNYRVEIGHENSGFDIENDAGIDGLNGISRSMWVRFRNQTQRSRLRNAYWLFSIDRKTSKTFRDKDRLARDHLAVFSVEYGFDSLDAETKGLNNLVAKYSHGEGNIFGAMDAYDDKSSSRILENGDNIGARFDKFNLSYTRLQTLTATSSLLLRAQVQYTDDPLVGLEQFTLGGASSVRAYPESEFTMDRGIFLSVEHIWNAPGFADETSWFQDRKWGEVLTVSAFWDWAHGEKLETTADENTVESLRGIGVGAQLSVPNSFTAKLSTAWPVLGSERPTNKRKPQVLFNFETQLF